jgi:hypothetical protein
MSIYSKLPNGYYVYAYLRQKSSLTAPIGTPYYIGKGQGYRAYSKDHACPLPSNLDYIIILEENLTEIGALALERRYINWYGRKDLGNGILHNRTDGGDMPPSTKGYKWKNVSPLKGVPNGKKDLPNGRKGTPSPCKGQVRAPMSESAKIKNSIAHRGKKQSELTKSKRLKTRKENGSRTGPSTGSRWWTNGIEDKISIECPGIGYSLGRSISPKNKGHKWWHYGNQKILSEYSPGPDWLPGTGIKTKGSEGLHWWTNGSEKRLCKLCPGEGWYKGQK